MSKLLRALLVSIVAGASAAIAWSIVKKWSAMSAQAAGGDSDTIAPRSQIDEVEALSDDHKKQLLNELDQHL